MRLGEFPSSPFANLASRVQLIPSERGSSIVIIDFCTLFFIPPRRYNTCNATVEKVSPRFLAVTTANPDKRCNPPVPPPVPGRFGVGRMTTQGNVDGTANDRGEVVVNLSIRRSSL